MEIRKSKQCGKSDTTHASHQRTLLCLKTVWEYTLMPHQMQGFVFNIVIGFLEYRHVISAAFVQIPIFIAVDRINFQTDIAEIFFCQPAGFPDILDITLRTAFSGQHQDFLNAGVCNDLHLMLDFLKSQFLTMNVVVAVKSAVHTVILAVVCNIKRCEQIHRISEMLACLDLCTLCHAL